MHPSIAGVQIPLILRRSRIDRRAESPVSNVVGWIIGRGTKNRFRGHRRNLVTAGSTLSKMAPFALRGAGFQNHGVQFVRRGGKKQLKWPSRPLKYFSSAGFRLFGLPRQIEFSDNA